MDMDLIEILYARIVSLEMENEVLKTENETYMSVIGNLNDAINALVNNE